MNEVGKGNTGFQSTCSEMPVSPKDFMLIYWQTRGCQC